MKIDLPAGWTQRGALPSDDEDAWLATAPDGRTALDVGWYPAGDADGSYGCAVIVDDDWQGVRLDRMRTPQQVREWVGRALARAGIRSAHTQGTDLD